VRGEGGEKKKKVNKKKWEIKLKIRPKKREGNEIFIQGFEIEVIWVILGHWTLICHIVPS
jgi:hypothetical protein